MLDNAYPASPVNPPIAQNDNVRRRATKAEMEERAAFLLAYAAEHRPVTVRQLFYAATVANLPGIDKDDDGYNKVQQQVLSLRREGRMPYWHIADLTRFMRKPPTHNSVADALEETAAFYRRALWRDQPYQVEVWVEKDALAGCLNPVTATYDVPLMVCRGFTSETFAHSAVEDWEGSGKEVHILHFGDFDRSGQDAAADLERKLRHFADPRDISLRFSRMAVTEDQVRDWGLSTRTPKRDTAADRRWPHDFACELDAIPPNTLRGILNTALDRYIPPREMAALLAAEESERDMLKMLAYDARRAA